MKHFEGVLTIGMTILFLLQRHSPIMQLHNFKQLSVSAWGDGGGLLHVCVKLKK